METLHAGIETNDTLFTSIFLNIHINTHRSTHIARILIF